LQWVGIDRVEVDEELSDVLNTSEVVVDAQLNLLLEGCSAVDVPDKGVQEALDAQNAAIFGSEGTFLHGHRRICVLPGLLLCVVAAVVACAVVAVDSSACSCLKCSLELATGGVDVAAGAGLCLAAGPAVVACSCLCLASSFSVFPGVVGCVEVGLQSLDPGFGARVKLGVDFTLALCWPDIAGVEIGAGGVGQEALGHTFIRTTGLNYSTSALLLLTQHIQLFQGCEVVGN